LDAGQMAKGSVGKRASAVRSTVSQTPRVPKAVVVTISVANSKPL
jgi:hypothetical protein